jgi:DNA-binding GntR family transcriptional regulator
MSTAEPPPSLSREAYERLRSEIVRGEIRPNQRLIAADLAERLKISRTPIREALQLLESDGLVEVARRGYVVREHTPDEIRQIYEVRAALEGMAARLAAERATDEQLRAIIDLHADDATLASSARDHLVEVNAAFHEAIVTAAGNPRLERVLRSNSEHFFNYGIAQLYSDDEASASVAGHAEIVAALIVRDADRAEAAARRHVLDALRATLSKVR